MTKDRFERKAYRRSPGRQYGYDYDPLRSNRGDTSQSGRLDSSEVDRSTIQFAQRPDPRRTRQLLRQNILAAKSRSTSLHEDELEQDEDELHASHTSEAESDQDSYAEQEDGTLYSNRYRGRSNRLTEPPPSAPQDFIETDEEGEAEGWNELDYVDPDIGYEEPLDQRLSYSQPLAAPRPRRVAPAH